MFFEGLALSLALLPSAHAHTQDLQAQPEFVDHCYDVSRQDGQELWGFDDFRFRLTDERIVPAAADRRVLWEGETTDLEDWSSALLSWRIMEVPNTVQVIGFYRGVSLEIRFAPVDGQLEGTARSVGLGQDVKNPIHAKRVTCAPDHTGSG